MRIKRIIVTVVVSTTALAASFASSAQAADQYSFPSSNGAMIATASVPQFVPPATDTASVSPTLGGSVVIGGASKSGEHVPLPAGSPAYKQGFAMRSQGGDAFAYRFLTHALSSQSFANYAADYYRLFAPGYAVTAWTDRVVSGFVETGYGGAVDSWTAGAHYLSRVRGPRGRRDSAPDLSTMPVFGPHPELEAPLTFQKGN